MGMTAETLASTKDMSRVEWLHERRNGLGGSDIPKIALPNYRWGSPMSVWLDKTGQVEPEESQSEAAELGSELEHFVAWKFSRKTGKKVRKCNKILRHREHKFMLANVDRLIVGADEGLECKCASEYLKDKWVDDELPDEYYLQVQWYMAVTGYQRWWIAALIGGNKFRYKCVERDDATIAKLIEIGRDFWWHVENRVPPAMDGSPASAQVLLTMYPQSNGQSIELAPDAVSLIRQREEAKADMEAAERRMKEAENRLKQLLGEHEVGWAGERKVVWKTFKSYRVDTKRLKADHPELVEQYLTPSVTRRFEIK